MKLSICLSLVAVALLIPMGRPATADELPVTRQSSAPIRVFIDCANCGLVFDNQALAIDDYFRQELSAIDYVRDRRQADIHILISWQKTGAGGTEFMTEFIGQGRFAQMRDTLVAVANESDTDDMIRAGLLRCLKLGLVRFVARTPRADMLIVEYPAAGSEEAAAQPEDPWKLWVFSIGASTQLSGEKDYRELGLDGNLFAKRTTENWICYLGISSQYLEREFDLQVYDGENIIDTTIESDVEERNLTAWVVRGLGDHWSIAMSSETNASTYSNSDLASILSIGLEYNIFPYSQSSRRMLRIEYYLGAGYYNYRERTIYGKTEEWLGTQRLSATADIVQPWGTVTSQLSARDYLHDLDKYRVWWTNQISIRVIEGLSVDLVSQMQRIYDQLSLPATPLEFEQMLLRTREQETSYQWGLRVGLSYSFGSIYNTIVNRRFGG